MKNPNYAPVYCAMYPELANIARAHGYALAVHGSVGRDFDLICVPWTQGPSDPEVVVEDMVRRFSIRTAGQPETKLHNRLVYTLSVGFGECFLDLSFMPRTQ